MDKYAGMPSWKRDLLIKKEAAEQKTAAEQVAPRLARSLSAVAKPANDVKSF